ncbi:MAG: glycoside hydrolase family 38 C-terminal domain-containing protein [Candidatus Borkfalkiaceae bacterium]|nr:glycoside hydrolase family 38 C-terminal domain-containing protein [Christensenellaceae bacterium]
MKKLHLICNAHIDPLWLWNWSDGIAAGVSTFSAAVELSERFDYVFCHNESLLYEAVKEYAPHLFQKIKDLVKAGKWHIMGGWYLQSDCNFPEGETVNRCLRRGLDFFEKEFGVRPETAVSFDSFGHSRGLVQILAGNGYQNYVICRPTKEEWSPERELFFWDGCDGSEIKVFRAGGHYNSKRGCVLEKIRQELGKNEDVSAVLWGVGNHGGGPSAADLKAISELIGNCETRVFHSTPDAFFRDAVVSPETRIGKPLQNCMPGCYTSMSSVKRRFRAAESLYYATEILASYASLARGADYPAALLDEAAENLLKCSFHDILPGTCIREGEAFAINRLGSAFATLEDVRLKAVYKLMEGEAKAREGEYPVFVFNPEPVAVRTVVACEFTLADQNYESYWSLPEAEMEGKKLPVQLVRESSNIPLDWSKRILIECELPPMRLSRISVYFRRGTKPALKSEIRDVLVHRACGRTVCLDPRSGLISSLDFGGESCFGSGLFRPVVSPDVPDPWMMEERYRKGYVGRGVPFRLLSRKRVAEFVGAGGESDPCYGLEKGEVCTRAESLFGYRNSRVRITYTFYENRPEIDVDVGVLWSERNLVLRLELPVVDGTPMVQGMLGREKVACDGSEHVMQKWVGVERNGKIYAVLNDGTYGCSVRNGVLSVNLLRGATYTSYPLGDLPMLSADGYVPSMDLGWHDFRFRIGCYDRAEADVEAIRFNRRPCAMNLFPLPSAENRRKKGDPEIRVEGKGIALLSMKRIGAETVIRLYNADCEKKEATLRVAGDQMEFSFNPYEVKSAVYGAHGLQPCEPWKA